MKKLIYTSLITIALLLLSILCFKPIFKGINYGIDLQGGFEVLYRIEPLEKDKELTETDLDNTYKAILNRIDTLGVSEPIITFEGDNILRIQLPGVSNEEEARERISTTAVLSFRDTEDNLLMTSDILGGSASLDKNQTNFLPVVKLDLKDSDKFYKVTRDVSKKSDGENLIVIWLDFEEEVDSFEKHKTTCGKDGNMKCISAPAVNEAINSDSVIIEGSFTKEEAQNLVDLINSGSLPTKLVEESTPRSVSASFGEETIQKSALAGIITLILITILMTLRYRVSGFISSICLIVYSLLVFLLFNGIGGVLTLTGIAALVLGVGMAIDSSVISIERVQDEVNSGKKLSLAFKEGNKRSLVAIIDANITTLIVGIILYIYGESAVKGFATMLIITIVITIAIMVVLNRFILKIFMNTKYFDDKPDIFLGKISSPKNYNFSNKGKPLLIVALSIIFISIVFAFTTKINFGIDFAGGTNISMTSEKTLNFDKILKEFENYEVVEYKTYLNNDKEGFIKLNDILEKEEELKIKENLTEMNVNVSINEISNKVTKNLIKNAIVSLVLASISIIIYMSLRFNVNFAIAGLLALLHDISMIVAVFIIFRIEFNFIIIASLLTIIGYSINDTIVVFDRIRENKQNLYKNKVTKESELKDLVNISSNETFSRNIQTSLTTVISVLCLLFLGINEIFTFNIAMLIGLIAGVLSTIFLAPNIWMYLEIKNLKRPEKKKYEDEIEEKLVKGVNS